MDRGLQNRPGLRPSVTVTPNTRRKRPQTRLEKEVVVDHAAMQKQKAALTTLAGLPSHASSKFVLPRDHSLTISKRLCYFGKRGLHFYEMSSRRGSRTRCELHNLSHRLQTRPLNFFVDHIRFWDSFLQVYPFHSFTSNVRGRKSLPLIICPGRQSKIPSLFYTTNLLYTIRK